MVTLIHKEERCQLCLQPLPFYAHGLLSIHLPIVLPHLHLSQTPLHLFRTPFRLSKINLALPKPLLTSPKHLLAFHQTSLHLPQTPLQYPQTLLHLLQTPLHLRQNPSPPPQTLFTPFPPLLLQISRIEFIHSKNFIHRDVKPDNFLMGLDKKGNLVYVIDFGLAKKYRDTRTHQHIPYRENKNLTGTSHYASDNFWYCTVHTRSLTHTHRAGPRQQHLCVNPSEISGFTSDPVASVSPS